LNDVQVPEMRKIEKLWEEELLECVL
jgi:hypothetical protein